LLIKLKSNKDHYQGQNEAWKSALHILQGLLLKCHIIYFLNKKNLKVLPQVNMLSLHLPWNFQLKILIFDPCLEVSKTANMVYWHFKNFHAHAGLGSLWLGTWWVRGELRLILGKHLELGRQWKVTIFYTFCVKRRVRIFKTKNLYGNDAWIRRT
jgi:hypothetical protein